MKYAWRTDGLFGQLDPQVAGEHIESLIERYQEHLTAEEVLADARRSRSPLNRSFDWDDSSAAEKYRRTQARALVQNLVPVKGGKKQRTRAFVLVHHSRHDRKVFMNIRSAMGRTDMRQQVVEQALKQLDGWVGRWGGQPEMRFLMRRVEPLRKRVAAELMAMV